MSCLSHTEVVFLSGLRKLIVPVQWIKNHINQLQHRANTCSPQYGRETRASKSLSDWWKCLRRALGQLQIDVSARDFPRLKPASGIDVGAFGTFDGRYTVFVQQKLTLAVFNFSLSALAMNY